MIRVVTAFLAFQCGFAAVASDGGLFRRWTDNTGNFSTRAALVEVDRSDERVTLRLIDGRSITMPLRRLSAEDRAFLDHAPRRETNQQPLRIAGLDWYEDLKDAQLIADGRNRPADDKPIMCFRVLGDMEGFM